MLNFSSTPDVSPVVSLLIAPASSLNFACLDGRLTSHPKFGSGYRWAYDDYFDREGADPGDMVSGVSVTVVDVVASITRSLLESDYGRESTLFFWLVGACAGILAALQATSSLVAEKFDTSSCTSFPYQTIQGQNIPLKRTRIQIWANYPLYLKIWLSILPSQRNFLTSSSLLSLFETLKSFLHACTPERRTRALVHLFKHYY